MSATGGVKTLTQIRQQYPYTTIILTLSENDENLLNYIHLGVRRALLKNIDADFLINTLDKVVQGGYAFSPEIIPH